MRESGDTEMFDWLAREITVSRYMAAMEAEYRAMCEAQEETELQCLADGTTPVWRDDVIRELPEETESE